MTDWWQQLFPAGRQTLTISDANGEQVAIAYGEKGTGQPLFLLHGIGSWSYSWRGSVKTLSQHFRTICVDAKGHGFSDKSFQRQTVGHQIEEAAAIVRSLSDQPAILVSESLGALTALAVAEQHPDLVDRLVLINAPVFPKRLPSAGMRWISALPLDWVRSFDQMQLIRPLAPLLREGMRIARREVVVAPERITDEELYWLTYPYVEFPGAITQFAAELQEATLEIERSLSNQPNLIHQIQQDLPKVTCPTLVLWADQDQWFPIEDGKELHRRLPNSQFRILTPCGHNASGCNPTAVNAAVLDFLRETAAL